MSKVVKGVAKVFKKIVKAVVKIVKKIAPIVLTAAAVYFGAGMAIGSFGGTTGMSFVSSMPGWGAGGLFTKAAVGLEGLIGGGAFTANAAGGVASALGAGASAGIAGAAPVTELSTQLAGTTAAGVSGSAVPVTELSSQLVGSAPAAVQSGGGYLSGAATGGGSTAAQVAAAGNPGKYILGGQLISSLGAGLSAQANADAAKDANKIEGFYGTPQEGTTAFDPNFYENGAATPSGGYLPPGQGDPRAQEQAQSTGGYIDYQYNPKTGGRS